MALDVGGMVGMEDPAKRLGEVIAGVDDSRDMMHQDFLIFFPFLDGEVLNGNMA